MFIHRTHSNGLARYAVKTEDNKELASISIEDGRYPGYTFIPVIVDLNGENDGLIFLLNWMTVNIKSPLGATIKYPLLLEYGFKHFKSGLIWNFHRLNDSNNEIPEVPVVIHT